MNVITQATIAFNSGTNTGKVISAVALGENKVNVIHSDSNNHLYSALCDVNDTTITKENDVQLSAVENSGSTISATALDESNIFIGHSSGTNNCLHGMLVGYLENLVKTITSSTEKIGGIALSSGQAEEMVTVKKPDEMLEITLNATIVAGGNSISWNNVKLSHRKVLDGSNKVYTTSKTLTINNIVYNFKLYLFYIKNDDWHIGCEFSPELYSTSTNPITFFNWVHYLTSKIYTETYYTGANKTGTAVTFTADVTI